MANECIFVGSRNKPFSTKQKKKQFYSVFLTNRKNYFQSVRTICHRMKGLLSERGEGLWVTKISSSPGGGIHLLQIFTLPSLLPEPGSQVNELCISLSRTA
ncbi:hypothetical protein ILYODFUR_038149 [Ilyodon furcidens]|uniref:Uncharacterized protein n=1 Tax=Ilyodon furcidens TaxID=33524 RepID=A0ABV0UFS0_9TELE